MTTRNFTRALFLAGACSVLSLGACSSAPQGSAGVQSARGGYAFWPLFPDDPRVQFVRSFQGSNDLAPAKSSALEDMVFGKEQENKEASLSKPYGVAMRNGVMYVCDMRAGSLVVMDLAKKQMRLVGTTGANRLSHPVAVAVADDGKIYVAESDRGAIVIFDAQERYEGSMGFPKFKPVSLAVHGGRLYATDMMNQAVQVFDRASGKVIGKIGSVGDADGQFRLPTGVATDTQGNVYVVDMMRGRLQKFDAEGKFLLGGGAMGDSAGTFARPKHISVDSEGLIYVVDSAFQNVQLFDDQMRVLMHFGAAGDHPGAMNMPVGICVDDGSLAQVAGALHEGFRGKRVIAVTNQFGNAKVSLYAFGEKKAGFEAADFARASVKIDPGVGASEETVMMQETVPAEVSEAGGAAPKDGAAAPGPTPVAPK